MDHKPMSHHPDPHVYDSGALANTAHEMAETKVQHTRTADLFYHRRSKVLAIRDFFPKHVHGDIFLVCGKLNETHRQITYISLKETGAAQLAKAVVAQAAGLFEKYGFSDLDVFIVPANGLTEKPDMQRNHHFSISTDAEWNRLLTPQGDHSQKGHRQLDSDRLLEILHAGEPVKQTRRGGSNGGLTAVS